MNQDWRGANITTGSGGSGGGRGGDVGSYNNTTNNKYDGDNFSGTINGGNVGGRNNRNTINNNVRSADDEVDEMQKRLEAVRAQIAAKKAARSQRDKLAADLAAAEAQLAELDD